MQIQQSRQQKLEEEELQKDLSRSSNESESDIVEKSVY